jgi:hypothetical protein
MQVFPQETILRGYPRVLKAIEEGVKSRTLAWRQCHGMTQPWHCLASRSPERYRSAAYEETDDVLIGVRVFDEVRQFNVLENT